ncbi:MAG: type IV secretory system conjugative DNA transfer family protein [Pseudomonadota bacterium]|nr:type IV secretory system conjugative DNA transfer family protein [Pseudomonadota bacterium]
MTLILGWPDATDTRMPIGFQTTRRAVPPEPAGPVRARNAESHWLCAAPTGSGKTRGFVIPQLLEYPGSAVVVDVKGEIAQVTARRRREMGEVLMIDPFKCVSDGKGAFNPLAHLDSGDPDYADDILMLAALFNNNSVRTKTDPFWDESAQNIIAGLLAAIVHLAAKTGDGPAYLADLYDRFHASDRLYDLNVMLDLNDDLPPLAEAFIGQYLHTNDTTRASIGAVAAQQLRMLGSEGVKTSFGVDKGQVDRLVQGDTVTVYIVLRPDRLVSHAGFARIILSSIMQRLMRRASRPRHPTLFIVDEATQLGRMPSLETAATLGRGYGVRLAMLIQSLAQLEDVYGDASRVFLENMALMTMGPQNSMQASRTLADAGFGDVSETTVHGLDPEQVIVKDTGQHSRILRKLDYLTDGMFEGRFDPNPAYKPAPKPGDGGQLDLFS